MRKALIVGTDYYESISHLHGCVQDAYNMKTVLDRHSDGTKNFDVLLETSTGSKNCISRKELKDPVKQAEQKQYAEWVNEYNLNYDLFLQGKRSSEVLMSLDNLQDKINGENTNK